jgi:nucleoside-diphosphate-sugar epimerase
VTGFIGSHLCERLLKLGNEVLCVDNFFTSRRENITHLLPNPRDESITLYGSGQQTRSFCYVDDLVIGMIAIMDQDDFVGPVDLGNPAEIVRDLAGSKSEIVYRPLPEDDPIRRCPDIRLAREKLGWEPVTPLLEGLRRTVNYFRESLPIRTVLP